MVSKYFDNIFIVSSDNLSGDCEEKFIFQGSKNWDFYLAEDPIEIETDRLENVNLLSFEDKKEFLNYVKNNDIIDYSLEHLHDLNRYLVLTYSYEN